MLRGSVVTIAKRFEIERLPDEQPIDLALADDPPRAALALSRQRWGASAAIYSVVRQLRAVADEFRERVLIGELWMPIRRLVKFYGRDLDGLHMPFNFQLITIPWNALAIHRAVARYEAALPEGAWPNWVVGNHDRSRIASRVGPGQARVAAVLLLTLRGTPTMYYGDELGMPDVPVPLDAQQDPQGLAGGESRDPERSPMRWDGSATAGFTDGTPWLPIGPDVGAINVEAERDDPDSMLSLYRRLLDLRRAEPALSVGAWHDLGHTGSVIAFLRTHGDRRFLIAVNLTSEPSPLPERALKFAGSVLISTLNSSGEALLDPSRGLAADEAIVMLLD